MCLQHVRVWPLWQRILGVLPCSNAKFRGRSRRKHFNVGADFVTLERARCLTVRFSHSSWLLTCSYCYTVVAGSYMFLPLLFFLLLLLDFDGGCWWCLGVCGLSWVRGCLLSLLLLLALSSLFLDGVSLVVGAAVVVIVGRGCCWWLSLLLILRSAQCVDPTGFIKFPKNIRFDIPNRSKFLGILHI